MEPQKTIYQFPVNPNCSSTKPLNTQVIDNYAQQNHQIQQEPIQQSENSQDFHYFMSCFSPKETALSLKKKNDNLQLLDFENSDEDPDEIYNKRKRKVQTLLSKEEQLQAEIQELQQNNPEKYQAIISFTKFIHYVNNNVCGIKTDYYSTKTFCALKNSTDNQISQLVDILKRMYDQILKFSENSTNSQSSSSKIQDDFICRCLEFLIIPRFLISRQKINRLIKQQDLQQSFIFLVTKHCLGHYNNESNKKMPTEYHMKFIREILDKKNGREKFKKISSINHGNKFQKNNPNYYYELYDKNYEYLKYLEAELKKGKKLATIRKKLDNCQPTQQLSPYSSHNNNENESSHSSASGFSFGSLNEEFLKIEIGREQKIIEDELIDDGPIEFDQFSGSMKKIGVKKLMSMPDNDQQKKQRKFTLKKSMTMQQKKTPTIILIKPPPADI